jgi:hypothetical protein
MAKISATACCTSHVPIYYIFHVNIHRQGGVSLALQCWGLFQLNGVNGIDLPVEVIEQTLQITRQFQNSCFITSWFNRFSM